jgi:hypothetical protein
MIKANASNCLQMVAKGSKRKQKEANTSKILQIAAQNTKTATL